MEDVDETTSTSERMTDEVASNDKLIIRKNNLSSISNILLSSLINLNNRCKFRLGTCKDVINT